jgi:hypothetical protein
MMMNREHAEQLLAQLQRGRSKHAMSEPTQLEDLDLRLEDVAMWCKRYANPQATRNCLRPARLAAHPLPANRWHAVDDVVAARRSELARTTDVTLDGVSGRLLVYFPDLELADGAAEAESQGFFDVHNAPPCGTWAGYFDEGDHNSDRSAYLLAWVPQAFVSLANRGILANPEECIVWLDDSDVPLRRIVEHLKIRVLTR